MAGQNQSLHRVIHSPCLWYSNYSFLPSELECTVSYCDNPTPIPNISGENYDFQWDGELVPLGADLIYPCQAGMKIENSTDTKEEASNSSIIRCGSDGEFIYPSLWAQCSNTVQCGQPPLQTDNGTRIWINSEQYEDSYGTEVVYRCVNGSQFDTDADGVGDTLTITLSCLWSKSWSPCLPVSSLTAYSPSTFLRIVSWKNPLTSGH